MQTQSSSGPGPRFCISNALPGTPGSAGVVRGRLTWRPLMGLGRRLIDLHLPS